MSNALVGTNGAPRMTAITVTLPSIYDQVYNVNSTITTGTNITLPASGTYNSTELQVFLNGQLLIPSVDYNYVGTVPRTQVSFTFDLLNGDRIVFFKERDF